ncbi:MAG: glycoside hydrolase family 3 N-terminal domain-containing protein [Spirochaetales bacterium]|nr:glycoside hydrolase family 3 N-terminal domain-containing protein [Spirochaetales bacterium]
MDIRQQAKEIVSKMTLGEKVAQLCALWCSFDENGNIFLKELSGFMQDVGKDDPFLKMKDGIGQITRPLGSQIIDPIKGVKALNKIQKFLVEETRLGIPALPHEECLSGLMAYGATQFTAGISYGATWDPDLVKKIANVIGSELYSVGSRQGLSPVLDIARDARWGRTEETFGEDPYLTGVLASSYVEGLQDEDHPVIATLKHFVGHSFSEGGRNHAPVRIGKRELNDVFLFPFEMAIKKAKAASVMPAYHDIDGEPLHQSGEYINSLLRDKWGFDGIVVSDYEGLEQLVNDHKTQPDYAYAAAASIKAGVDVELPGNTLFGHGVAKAIDKGLLDMSELDEAVTRHLMQKIRVGLLKNPYIDEGLVLANLDDHAQIALEAAEKSMVLLKNDGVLPLKGSEKIALIGPLADEPMGMLGGYAFPVHLVTAENKDNTSTLKTLRASLSEVFGDSLSFEKGCDILTGRPDKPAVFPGDVTADGNAQEDFISYETGCISNAVSLAEKSDIVVLAVGDLAGLFLSGTVGEGSDVSSLSLPGVQQQLVDEVVATGTPVIIVVYSGRPYYLGEAGRRSGAIIQGWLPGQGGADATTNILTGKTNPGGKLPVSIPREAGAMPYFYNHKLKSAGTPIQKEYGAEYPFGHGCSYSDFEITSISADDSNFTVDGNVVIKAKIKNISSLVGEEVLQVYVRDIFAKYVRPVKELKAFSRITLKPEESASVEFSIPSDLLSFTVDNGQRLVEPGQFDFMIGTSSENIQAKLSLDMKGEARILPENWRMQSSVSIRKS